MAGSRAAGARRQLRPFPVGARAGQGGRGVMIAAGKGTKETALSLLQMVWVQPIQAVFHLGGPALVRDARQQGSSGWSIVRARAAVSEPGRGSRFMYLAGYSIGRIASAAPAPSARKRASLLLTGDRRRGELTKYRAPRILALAILASCHRQGREIRASSSARQRLQSDGGILCNVRQQS